MQLAPGVPQRPAADTSEPGQQPRRQLNCVAQYAGRKRGEREEGEAAASGTEQHQHSRQRVGCDQAQSPRLPLPLPLPAPSSKAAAQAANPPSTPAPVTPQAPSLELAEDPGTPRALHRGLSQQQGLAAEAGAAQQHALAHPAPPPLSPGSHTKLLPSLPPLPPVPADHHKVKQANAILEATDSEPEDVVPSTAELAAFSWEMGIDLRPAASTATSPAAFMHQQQRDQQQQQQGQALLPSTGRRQQQQGQQQQQPASSQEWQPGVMTPRQGSVWEDSLEAVLQLPSAAAEPECGAARQA